MNQTTLVLGAVAYDPKVVTIWDGFLAHFKRNGLAFDFVLYENYERQVQAQLAGQIDVAWNSPLAWLQTERAARRLGRKAHTIAMRDSDRDLTSVVLVRARDAITELAHLKGKKVAVGAADSPQATLIPLFHLAQAGLEPEREFEVVRHDLLLGKHGDHIGGEREAVKALVAGAVDAACIIGSNHLLFTQEGTAPPGALRVLSETPRYDHCNFTVLDGAPTSVEHFRALLFEMSYDDPAVRRLLELEGLKAWLPGRVEGYAILEQAVDRFGFLDPFLATITPPEKVKGAR